jgi:hypothetical protein
MGEVEYWRRVKSGVYFDEEYDVDTTDNASGEVDGNESKTEMTNNVIEGKSRQNPGDLDRNQDLLEIYTFLMIDDDPYSNGEYAPYIVTIKEATNEIVGLYRNWHKDDKRRQKLDYIAKFDFIPWRGAVGIGLGQIIGSLSVGATGALRALLDSAHINNIPTALGMKGLKMAGQSADINVGQITYLEGPASLDGDIRKWMMPLPFNPPSPVLFQLLEWLTNAAGKLIKMPDGGLEQMGDRTPASTSLAIIEQNSMTQSAIHRRLHYSQAKCFDIVSRLLADYFDPEGYPEEIVNDYGVNNKLFLNTADIIPVSDPNIFTEAQRYAQIQALSGLKAQYQGLINDAEVLRRTLKALKIPDPETLMNVPNQVSRANPIAENMTCFLGNSIAVFPEQDHLAHIKIHAKFLQDPAYGANPLFSQGVPALTEHMKQHLLYFYAQTYQTLMDAEKEDTSVNLLAKKHTEQNFDDELLSISDAAEAYMHQQLQEFAPLLQQIMQQQQQAQQAAQAQDPNMAKIALEQQELQQDSQQQQAENQLAQQKLQLEAQEMQQEGALKQQQMELQAKTATMAAVSKHQAMMDEVQISKDRNRADVELEQLRIKIEEIKAMASIKSTNEQFEHSQWSQILKHIEHMDKLSNDMTKHESQLEHDTKIQQAQENAQTVASLGQQ